MSAADDAPLADSAAAAAAALPQVLATTTAIVGIASDMRKRLVEEHFSPEGAERFVFSYLLGVLNPPSTPSPPTVDPS